jgi:ribonuclease E
MLIDASHPEETRVVVLDGQKVEEFDFEAASKRPLKGNIYLAKVTRVEPSLQAAFVEYGGNRQGFLAFSEIHPDYYQIPVADRQALLAEQEAEARRHSDDDFESIETASVAAQDTSAAMAATSHGEQAEQDGDAEDTAAGGTPDDSSEQPSTDNISSSDAIQASGEERPNPSEDGHDASTDFLKENLSGVEELMPAPESTDITPSQTKASQSQRPQQRWTRRRHYKIQEVIKRRQIILVQVVKEERGNKGAALTTYLSLAGRYCVLMPNTPRGGGISRKITSATDRTRLKSAAQSLELPEGMGLIIRTAGENRTKAEIKRDYEYLLRMWDTIRELTLKSNAPACVYEEGDLIKRAIRDLYNKDVSEIVVEGDDGYRNAKDFMRMLMPSHAKNVKPYKEPVPLFQRYQIESQLDAMFSPTVTLKSGGYVVINQTEALVAIDVNSGRATREHSIEDTAYKTNLEAAEEVARQLRLRDLAGLIVIDFIDMEDSRNDRNVEKRLRDCIKYDRARVQIGKISQFGLLEMSRQRLRAGVVAGSTVPCPHCGGQGIVRSVESTALRLLRALEEEGQRQRAESLNVRAATDVAIYTLNQKRRELARIESEYALSIQFEPKDDGMMTGTFEIDRIGQRIPDERVKTLPPPEAPPPIDAESSEPETEESDGTGAVEATEQERPQVRDGQPTGENGGHRKRRRRRRGRDRERVPVLQEPVAITASDGNVPIDGNQDASQSERTVPTAVPVAGDRTVSPAANGGDADAPRKRRRRRRGRRGGSANGAPQTEGHSEPGPAEFDTSETDEGAVVDHEAVDIVENAPESAVEPETTPAIVNSPSVPAWSLTADPGKTNAPEPISLLPLVEAPEQPVRPPEPSQPPRKGWWQRPFRSKE